MGMLRWMAVIEVKTIKLRTIEMKTEYKFSTMERSIIFLRQFRCVQE